MRIHTTLSHLDSGRLTPGADLVLEMDETEGLDLRAGVLVDDHLGLEDRREVDRAALSALVRWRALYDERLTVERVCLPFLHEWDLLAIAVRAARSVAGLRRALERHRPAAISVMDGDPFTRAMTVAVAERVGVPVTVAGEGDAPSDRPGSGRRVPPARRMRRAFLRVAWRFGVPSLLRNDSIVVIPYWPLTPLIDRMLSEGGWRPAVLLSKRPVGPSRILRTAARGGWVGLPGTRAIHRAARPAQAALDAALGGSAETLDLFGCRTGTFVHARFIDLLRSRAGADLATAAVARRAFGGGRVSRLVGTYDIEAETRVVMLVAREAGIPILQVAHGAYLLPQQMADMELGDEAALWSWEIAPPIANRDRPIHVVGYPLPHELPASRAPRPEGVPPRVVILGQNGHPSTATVDARLTMRHYMTAIRAVSAHFPEAKVVLRPHPSDPATLDALPERFPSLDLEVDGTSAIMEVLAGSDLCIGGTSAATMQAALAGTPVIVLNLSGFDWPWPLGGDTAVPVARSEQELAVALDGFAREPVLPGAEDLRRGLGANGGDAPSRLLRILADRPQRPARNEPAPTAVEA